MRLPTIGPFLGLQMATQVQTTRGRTASASAHAGAVSRSAGPSVRDPLLVDGPRVLLRMPDLSAGILPQEQEVKERDEPIEEQVEPAAAELSQTVFEQETPIEE